MDLGSGCLGTGRREILSLSIWMTSWFLRFFPRHCQQHRSHGGPSSPPGLNRKQREIAASPENTGQNTSAPNKTSTKALVCPSSEKVVPIIRIAPRMLSSQNGRHYPVLQASNKAKPDSLAEVLQIRRIRLRNANPQFTIGTSSPTLMGEYQKLGRRKTVSSRKTSNVYYLRRSIKLFGKL